jgi:hypothetical protein
MPRSGQWVRRNAAGGAPAVTPGVDVLNFGTVTGQVSLPAGTKAAVGGTVHVAAMSAWGEPLATATISVTSLNVNGPWTYKFTKVPNYKGVKVTATYTGQTTPYATIVAGESTAFDVKANLTKTSDVALTASVVQ